jgi:hypothetical protein
MTNKTVVAMSAWLASGFLAALAQTPAAPAKTNQTSPEAIDLLRRVIAEQQKNPDKIIRLPASGTNAPALGAATNRTELERQYLAGHLTAKQYQKALDQFTKEEQKRAAELEKKRKREAEAANTKPAPVTASKPAGERTGSTTGVPFRDAPAEPTPEQKKVSDVEVRIEEMLRQRAAREKATTATNSARTGPLTKRQRMDALLKEMIDGKITEAEYSARRGKLLAEPD